jgi:membrane-bound lytic murein transglycosylase A
MRRGFALLAALALAGCQSPGARIDEARPTPAPAVKPVEVPAVTPAPVIAPPPPAAVAPPAQPAPEATPAPLALDALKPAVWADLPGWTTDDLAAAWPAWLQSCSAVQRQTAWRNACKEALAMAQPGPEQIRAYFENRFAPYQLQQPDGSLEGLVTGYYEPLLRGSRTPSAVYRYPLRAAPGDLLTVDLSAIYPELKNLRLRGRLEGNKVVPYFSRADIESGKTAVSGKELAWVDDAVELFFLQIQGSGRIQTESGETIRVGYADQNGHPYRSIGKWLVDQGELSLEKASMQSIKDWALAHPERLAEMLAVNPSYVYFRELTHREGGPLGALGVPLTDERSIAVDPRAIPLGAPVWLATTRPNSNDALQRLMLAQDTGGAIKGNVRADFFWGFGDGAGKLAGAMKQKGRMWLLLPRDYPMAGNGMTARSGL